MTFDCEIKIFKCQSRAFNLKNQITFVLTSFKCETKIFKYVLYYSEDLYCEAAAGSIHVVTVRTSCVVFVDQSPCPEGSVRSRIT